MENDTFSGAILAWVKSAKAFLKVQAGTGDNLLEEDIREGFTDYCLWSTFRPECIDTDGELDMECLDSGMVLFRENCTPREALESYITLLYFLKLSFPPYSSHQKGGDIHLPSCLIQISVLQIGFYFDQMCFEPALK